ncbi:MAG: ADP-glyceromanno-heptose 6-epimerase [Pseudomonadota bacterium]
MVVVTGANGFIGSAIVWELNQKGIEDIICVDPVPVVARPGLLDHRKYDKFMDQNEFLNYLENGPKRKIDWIIHMGACSSTTEMNVDFLRENNTLYTQKLFEYCRDHQASFVYASSGACYGDGTQGFDDQTDPETLKPLNPYGDSKVNFDRWVLTQKDFPPLWMGLRFFNVYGPHEYYKKDMSSVVFKAYRQIKVNGSLKLFRSHNPDYKDGEQLRDFVYVKDITHWISQIMDGQGYSGIFNMGFGKARSWLDLATQTFKSMNREMNIEWVDIPEDIRPRYQYFTEAKMERFLSQGFSQPKWSLEDGITDYIQYLDKQNPFL